MHKKILFLFLVILVFKVNSLPWDKNQFKKMTPNVEKCLENVDIYDKPLPPTPPPLVAFDCSDNDPSPWDYSYYVVNKANEYIYLDKPISISNLTKATGEDQKDYPKLRTRGLEGPNLILKNGNRYAQLCFYVGLSGKQICEVNIYVDLVEGKVTFPEIAHLGSKIDSASGFYYYSTANFEKNEDVITIRKMFSKLNKEIKIPVKGAIIYEGKFLPGNKIQIVAAKNFNKTNEVKFKKIFSFDPKQLDD